VPELNGHAHADGNGHANGHGHPQGLNAMTKGCLAGTGVCFISHQGEIFPCGYLPLPAGDLRQQSFHEVWQNSSLFATLRDVDQLQGKCGVCEFKRVCSGCRARAHGWSGEFLAEEPFCVHQPKSGPQLVSL
ncbi:MAG: SPASM domain-containing protein, partial [Bryobacteraceae bacterium]|nr:SPASM domain-containing protein [Bryobacteraceae bacterium]